MSDQPHEERALQTARENDLSAMQTGSHAREAAERHAVTDAHGELKFFELSFRAGLLVGSGVFFYEALGPPWERNLFGVAGFCLSTLIVLTLVFKWRTLGDWRRRTQQVLYLLLLLVLSMPVSAALSPTIGQSSLPNGLETVLVELFDAMESVPGATVLLGLAKGVISFLFLGFTLVVLLLGSSEGRRAGVILVAILLGGICLFFYPMAETIAGFAFLVVFYFNQWETPLLVPDKLRPHLRPVQVEFLRELVREGSLSTGETKVYLDNEPRYFAELLDFKLVDYDSIARDVLPGPRLLHDPAANSLESGLSLVRRGLWILVGIIYFILPDFIPGPIDDLIVMLVCTGSGLQLFDLFRTRRQISRPR